MREAGHQKQVAKGGIRELVFPRGDCYPGILAMVRLPTPFRLSRILVPTTGIGVLAALATVGLWQWELHRDASDRENVDRLNRMVSEYRQRTGRCPDLNMLALFRAGLSDKRLHSTPYGGTYQIDPGKMLVYNPHRNDR